MARAVGVVLLLLGLAGLAWGGFQYAQERHRVEFGSITLNVTEKKTIPIPPTAGAAAVLAGLVLLVAGSGRSKGASV
jgi:TRAP-type C4-dicarboxylate transport system permease small subunit